MALNPNIPLQAGQMESPLLALGRGIQSGQQMAANRQAMGVQQKQEARAQQTFDAEQQQNILLQSGRLAESLIQQIPATDPDYINKRRTMAAQLIQSNKLPIPLDALDEDGELSDESLNSVIGLATDRVEIGKNIPSNVREWAYFNKLAPEEQKRYLLMKRAGKIVQFGDVPLAVDELTGTAQPIESGLGTTQEGVQSALSKQQAEKAAMVETAKQTAKSDVEKAIAERGQATKLGEADRIYKSLVGADLSKIYGKWESLYPDQLRSQEGINLMADRDQLVGMILLASRGELKGQGPITEGEQGILSQAATALANPRIGPEKAREALDSAMGILYRNAGQEFKGGTTQQPVQGPTAVNPQTGETVIFNGTEWVPVAR